MVHPKEHRVSIEHPSPRSIAAVTNSAFVLKNVVVDDAAILTALGRH